MGKAAQNEQHKLMAAFYNNLAITATASGVLLPVFGLIGKYGEWARGRKVHDAMEMYHYVVETVDLFQVLGFLVVFGFTAWVAYRTATFLREKADEEAAKIQD